MGSICMYTKLNGRPDRQNDQRGLRYMITTSTALGDEEGRTPLECAACVAHEGGVGMNTRYSVGMGRWE